jgi:carboxylesterase
MRFLVLGVLLAVALLILRRVSERRARRNLRRLPRDANGIIVGAAAIELPRPSAPAALLLHGFGDTPQTLAYLAGALAVAGYAVRVPLLPGHGRSVEAFARSRASEWVAAAREAYEQLRHQHTVVALCGLSMGGALAAILAAEVAEPSAMVLIAPYLAMPWPLRLLARVQALWSPVVPYLAGTEARSILDPVENDRNLAYRVSTPRSGYELLRVVERARRALPLVTAPTLTLQSRTDNRIPAEVALDAFRRVGSPEKRLHWVAGCAHVITVDYCRAEVLASTCQWLNAHGGSGEDSAAAPGGHAVSL